VPGPRFLVAHACVLIGLAAAGVSAASTAPVVDRSIRLGASVQGRTITVIERGDPNGPKVLVVGCVHGNEPAGIRVAAWLQRARPPAGIDLWILPDLNPDGVHAGTRGNVHGVDLNRNFPWTAAAFGAREPPGGAPDRPPAPAHHDLVPPTVRRRRRVRRRRLEGASLRPARPAATATPDALSRERGELGKRAPARIVGIRRRTAARAALGRGGRALRSGNACDRLVGGLGRRAMNPTTREQRRRRQLVGRSALAQRGPALGPVHHP